MQSHHKKSFAAEQFAKRQKKVNPNLLVLIVILGFIVVIGGAYVVKIMFMVVEKPETEKIKSIAVLAFDDTSQDSNQEYYCDGDELRIAEQLWN